MDQVSRIAIDTAPGGAILRAVGLPPTQGYFEGALVLTRSEPGVLTYAFRIVPPTAASRVSTERSREVVVGLFLSDQTLEGIREIRVQGARNARGLRR